MRNDKKSLDISIKRVRARLASGIKTGSTVSSSICPTRTSPITHGQTCPTVEICRTALC